MADRREAAPPDTVDFLRILGHEAAQLTAGLNALLRAYFRDPTKLRALSDEKLTSLSEDFSSYLTQLNMLFHSVNALNSETLQVRFEHVRIPALYARLTEIFRSEITLNQLNIEIGESPPVAWADPLLLEQLLFNLIANAVKFAFRATSVRLTGRTISEGQALELSVTNFGPPIEESRLVYEQGFRGREAALANVQGLGLGLFISRQIAEAHGGSIDHTCRMVESTRTPERPVYEVTFRVTIPQRSER